MGWPKSLSIIVITAVTVTAGALILSTSYRSSPSQDNVAAILGLDGQSERNVQVAEAAILPMEVRDTFKNLEKTGDAKIKDSLLQIDTDFVDPDNHCEFCYRIEFTPGDTGKGGFVMKADKAFDLSEANRIAFFAKGETGKETVQFKAGGKENRGGGVDTNSGLAKFAFTSESTKLKNDWQLIEMDISGKDLKRITHALAVDLGRADLKNSNESIIIYLKGITFDDLQAQKSLRSAAEAAAG
jgi:hypothetical protein